MVYQVQVMNSLLGSKFQDSDFVLTLFAVGPQKSNPPTPVNFLPKMEIIVELISVILRILAINHVKYLAKCLAPVKLSVIIIILWKRGCVLPSCGCSVRICWLFIILISSQLFVFIYNFTLQDILVWPELGVGRILQRKGVELH